MDRPRTVAYTMLIAASVATIAFGGMHPSATPGFRDPIRVVRIGGEVGGSNDTSSIPAPFTTFASAFAAASLPAPIAMGDASIERPATQIHAAPHVVHAAPGASSSGGSTVPAPPVSLSDVTDAVTTVTTTVTTTAGGVASVLPVPTPSLPLPLPSLSSLTSLLP